MQNKKIKSKHVQNLSICNLSKYFSSQHQHYLRKLPSEFQALSVKDKKNPKKYLSTTQKRHHFEVEFQIGSRNVFVKIMIRDDICHSRHCRRQCLINLRFLLLKNCKIKFNSNKNAKITDIKCIYALISCMNNVANYALLSVM